MDVGRLQIKNQRHIFSLYRFLLLFYCGVFFLSSIKEKKERSNIINASKATTTTKFALIIQIKTYQIFKLTMFPMNDFRSKMIYRYLFKPSFLVSCLYYPKYR